MRRFWMVFSTTAPRYDETPISTLANEAIALFSRNVIEALHLPPRHFRHPPAPPSVPFRFSSSLGLGVRRLWDRHDGIGVALGLWARAYLREK
jgi:hypothetical protein